MRPRSAVNVPLRTAALLVVLFALVSVAHVARSGDRGDRVGGVIAVSNLPWQIGRALAVSDELHVSRAAELRALSSLADSGLPLFCGGDRRYAALTFDDGPSPTSGRLLRLLRRAGVPATFFLIGQRARQLPRTYEQLRRAGAIGNHTWNHVLLTQLKPAAIASELRWTQMLFAARRTGGQVLYRMMRPPYGARNAASTAAINREHYAEILWSADSGDALGKPWQAVASAAVEGLGPGAVILMHDGPPTTLTALRQRVLPAIRRSHLTMVTVPELLVLDPPGRDRLMLGPHGCRQAGKVNVSGDFSHLRGEG